MTIRELKELVAKLPAEIDGYEVAVTWDKHFLLFGPSFEVCPDERRVDFLEPPDA